MSASDDAAVDASFLKWLWQDEKTGRMRSNSASQAFQTLDEDGSGSVSAAELAQHGLLSDSEVEKIMGHFDVNGDGELQFEEFQRIWQEAIATKQPPVELDDSSEPLFIVRDKLKCRAAASLQSKIVGDVEAGTKVCVLQKSSDGHRAQISNLEDKETPLGWVSVIAKDGFENVVQWSAASNGHVMGGGAPPLAHVKNRHRRASVKETLMSLAHGPTPSRRISAEGYILMSEEEKHEAWVGAVRRCVLLQHLSPAELNFVSQARREIETLEGQTLYQQGDSIAQGLLYVVALGVYRVTIETTKLGVAGTEARTVTRRTRDYGPQETFGACELLCNDTRGLRTCTVVVHKPGLLWGIPRRLIDLKLRVPPPPSIPGLVPFCRQIKLFSLLSDERLTQLCRGAVQVDLAPGESRSLAVP